MSVHFSFRDFSRPMREIMLDHIDGTAVRIVVTSSAFTSSDYVERGRRHFTTKSLIERGWLKTEGGSPPKWTVMTERGRNALCRLLADYADALTRAGMDPFRSPDHFSKKDPAKPSNPTNAPRPLSITAEPVTL